MIALIVHGGAWDIPDDIVEPHRKGCLQALNAGWETLRSGGSSVDAVERTIRVLEDDPVFDAGRGSHLNALGEIELDASIMNGTTFRCGAVAAVQNIRNPITLARKVMEESEHILLVGKGAVRFARENGIPQCSQSDLLVGRELERWRELQRRKKYSTKEPFQKKFASDTVGAVALDRHGVICAGTSTGGTPNKYPGRVGDSPLIGCGTYADSSIGGVSTTGWGEAMIKVVLAKTVIDYMQLNGGNPQTAAERGIETLKRKADGDGGVIVLTPRGDFGIAFNTPRMARAYINETMDSPVVAV
jgi:beta-aspartyl-peptidase (threonine type)